MNSVDFTTGEGSILVEIDAEMAPITPEVLSRPRRRAPWLRPQPDSSSPAGRPVTDAPHPPAAE
jgi:hypothetical protein